MVCREGYGGGELCWCEAWEGRGRTLNFTFRSGTTFKWTPRGVIHSGHIYKRQELAKSVGKKFTWLHPISADSLLVLDRVVSNRNEISGAGGKQAQIVSSQLRHPSSDLGKGLQLGVGAGWN